MISKMIVCIGHCHAKHNTLPQFLYIFFRCCSVCFQKRNYFKITTSVRCVCTILFTKHSHCWRKVNSSAFYSVKSLYKKCRSQSGKFFSFCLRNIKSTHNSQFMYYHFPCPGIKIIMFRRKFSNPKWAIRRQHRGFGSRPSQRRSGSK